MKTCVYYNKKAQFLFSTIIVPMVLATFLINFIETFSQMGNLIIGVIFFVLSTIVQVFVYSAIIKLSRQNSNDRTSMKVGEFFTLPEKKELMSFIRKQAVINIFLPILIIVVWFYSMQVVLSFTSVQFLESLAGGFLSVFIRQLILIVLSLPVTLVPYLALLSPELTFFATIRESFRVMSQRTMGYLKVVLPIRGVEVLILCMLLSTTISTLPVEEQPVNFVSLIFRVALIFTLIYHYLVSGLFAIDAIEENK